MTGKVPRSLCHFPAEASSIPATRSALTGIPTLYALFPAEVPTDASSVPATRPDLAYIPATKFFTTGALIQGVQIK